MTHDRDFSSIAVLTTVSTGRGVMSATRDERVVAFLAGADGWRGLMPGWELAGSSELEELQEDAAETFDNCETDDAIADSALVVGRSENDASMLFYDRRTRRDDGSMELVRWLYEDEERYPSLEHFFAQLLENTGAAIAEERKARAALEEEWSATWRAQSHRELLELCRSRLAGATLAPPMTRERVAKLRLEPADAATDPSSLLTADAALCATLVVTMRGAPSPHESRAIVAAFRAAFPEADGAWATPVDGFDAVRLSDSDDALDALLKPGRGGALGVNVILVSGADAPKPSFLRGVAVQAPELDINALGPFARERSAACIAIKAPVGTQPRVLRRLADTLAGLVPFVSGYVSYGAVATGVPGVTTVYGWSRRFLAIDVRDWRLELGVLHEAVKNAAWITMVGASLVHALEERFGDRALAFDSESGIVTRRQAHGLVIEAGDLDLGDTRRGDFPYAIAEVDRRIAPLRLRGFANEELLSIGGVRFTATYTTYDGPFGHGSATHDWLERYIAIEGHLGPTPAEVGEAHVAAIDAAVGSAHLDAWRASKKRGDFYALLHQITVSAHGHEASDTVMAALAWAARFPGHAQSVAVNKLLYGFLLRAELDAARPYLGLVEELGPENPMLFHNAACVLARLGDRTSAIAHVRAAKDHGYKAFAAMRTDDDLKTLFGDPAFDAIFA